MTPFAGEFGDEPLVLPGAALSVALPAPLAYLAVGQRTILGGAEGVQFHDIVDI